MEEKILKGMMIRFFDAELTAEEERELCCWLRENDVPAELRKDKETIIALCAEPIVAELPKGAVQRLEAMLDGLAEEQQRFVADTECVAGEGKQRFMIPRPAVRVAVAAAAVLLALFVTVSGYDSAGKQTDAVDDYTAGLTEEDTFDNPEDAMRCFKVACGDMLLAINAARNNTYEIENVLEKTVNPYMELLMFIEKK